jgi:hypothetical protein
MFRATDFRTRPAVSNIRRWRAPGSAVGLTVICAFAFACSGAPQQVAAPAASPTPTATRTALPSPSPPATVPLTASSTPAPTVAVPPGPGGVLGFLTPTPGGAAAPLPTVQVPQVQFPPTPASTSFALPPSQPTTPPSGSAAGPAPAPPTSTPVGGGPSVGSGLPSLPGLPGLGSAPIATSAPPPPVVQPTVAPPRPTPTRPPAQGPVATRVSGS